MFFGAGLAMLSALYFAFIRVLRYLESVEVIGPALSWKLASMVLLMTFAMVVISSIIISMTTLYYSYDLKFLFTQPINLRLIFTDKAVETVFYSSWTLILVLLPFVIALGKVKSLGIGFYLFYLVLTVPFVMIASSFGIIFSMLVMYAFPSSRTRDITWILGSLSASFVYMFFRFSKPEKLIRPDTLEVVAQYVRYIQAPTAEYLPSWWLTKAMMGWAGGNIKIFFVYTALLFSAAALIYGAVYCLSGFVYMRGFSGAQGTGKFKGKNSLCFEQKLVKKGFPFPDIATLAWKDRKLFARDARYWSQIILIAALIAVYLFSIKNLPLDSASIKSMVCFLNIGVAGFVVAAIGLRFTFPSISLENNNYWIIKSAPITLKRIMLEKLVVSAVPSLLIGVMLVSLSNKLLNADLFISILSLATIIIASVVISIMGIGLGAFFPDFRLENIHQIESSYGGFIYMACCMGYLSLVVALEAWPVQMHFAKIFGRANAWDFKAVAFCGVLFILLNLASAVIPWKLGLKNLEKHEIL